MAATGTPVFHGLVYGSMLVANEEIQALAARLALECPRWVERVRREMFEIAPEEQDERVAA